MKVCTTGMRKNNDRSVGTEIRIPKKIMIYLIDFLIFLDINKVKKSHIKIT